MQRTPIQAPVAICMLHGHPMLRCMHAGDVGALRDVWESTGFALERLQSSLETVSAEQAGLSGRQAPKWALPWTPAWTPDEALSAQDKPRVAVLRWGSSYL